MMKNKKVVDSFDVAKRNDPLMKKMANHLSPKSMSQSTLQLEQRNQPR
jgi:hypothetical protein